MFLESSLDLPKSIFPYEIAKRNLFQNLILAHAFPEEEPEQSEIELKIFFPMGIPDLALTACTASSVYISNTNFLGSLVNPRRLDILKE